MEKQRVSGEAKPRLQSVKRVFVKIAARVGVSPTIITAVRTVELSMLFAVGIAGAGIAVFLGLASEMTEGETHAIDRWLLLTLRNPSDLSDPIGPPWLDRVMLDITALGGIAILTLITLAAVGFLVLIRKRLEAWIVLLSVGFGVVVTNLLKLAYGRERPGFAPRDLVIDSLSFPSGHAMMSAVVYLTLGALLARSHPDRRLRIYLIALSMFMTAVVGFSRVYLAVHWPTDVLAGWAVGAVWAICSWVMMSWLQTRQTAA